MGKKLTRKCVLAVSVEAVEGVAETLDGAEANILIVEPKFDPDLPMYKREIVDASLLPFEMIPGTQKATCSFKVEVKGSGTAGTAPAIGKLLRGCGWKETLVAVTSATYTPYSGTDIPSLTIALYKDGLKKLMRGARGSVKYSARLGEPGMFEFTFMGVFDGVTDAAILVGTGIETTIPRPLLSAVFSIAGFAAFISQLSWDQSSAMEMRGDVNDATGFISCLLGARDFKGSFDPEEGPVATHDWYGRWKAGTTGALTWKHPGSAGNIVTFTAPKVQYSKIAEASRGVIAVLNTDFVVARNASAGDDEM